MKAGATETRRLLADNVQHCRRKRGLRQSDLALAMSAIGLPWSEGIVGFVERNERNVTTDELLALAAVFGENAADLLLEDLS